MLSKRIIPCLDIKNGRTVKGVYFNELRDAGDPLELAKRYVMEGADELVFLDITATVEKRRALIELVTRIAENINIPFTVGGGINSREDVSLLLGAGADKVSINSAAVRRPELIRELSEEFGSQCIVLAVDTKQINGEWKVFLDGGRTVTEFYAISWALEAEKLGAGEILLTSMNHDGAKQGFALEITKAISTSINIPLIASGGAGEKEHFAHVFTRARADAALAASVFHFSEINIPELKKYLKNLGINVRI